MFHYLSSPIWVVAVNPLQDLTLVARVTRHNHSYSYTCIQLQAKTKAYRQCFSPWTAIQWTASPSQILEAETLGSFRVHLA